MPYVEGESLREKLDRERQLPVDEAVRIASDVAEALSLRQTRLRREVVLSLEGGYEVGVVAVSARHGCPP